MDNVIYSEVSVTSVKGVWLQGMVPGRHGLSGWVWL